MKTPHVTQHAASILALAALSTLSSQLSTAHAQGDLAPPGAPAPTMKSLDQVEARTPIASLPFAIVDAGSYYLTTNLSGDSLTIETNNVTLDLNGFTLGPGSGDGIHCDAVANIVIRNGIVQGRIGDGIDAVDAAEVVIKDIVASGNSSGGIRGGDDLIIESCLVVSNNSLGIRTGNRSTVHRCVAGFNGGDGIFALSYNTVTDCRATSNTGDGIEAFGSSSRVADNHCSQNGSNGDGAGIKVSGGHCRVDGNFVELNDRGLEVSGAGSLVIKNKAHGNGTNYVTSGTVLIGPIISGSGSISSENPWANFEI